MFRGQQPREQSVSAAVTLMAVGGSISGPKAVPPGLSGSASHLPLWGSALFTLDFLVPLHSALSLLPPFLRKFPVA